MDFAALQSAVRARLNSSSDDPLAASIGDLVNMGLHYVETANATGWPWMRVVGTFSTVTSTSTYTFATIDASNTIAKLLAVKLLVQANYYQPLQLMAADEAWQCYPSTVVNRPESYFVEGSTLYLYPTPDAVYTVGYRAVLTEDTLSADADTPTMPVVWHGAIVDAALTLAYQTIQDTQRANYMEQRVGAWVARMRGYGTEYRGGVGVKVREWI